MYLNRRVQVPNLTGVPGQHKKIRRIRQQIRWGQSKHSGKKGVLYAALGQRDNTV
jgi:hypothetical protein